MQAPLIARQPKVQLHCHLEGTVRAATFRELAAQRGVASARASGPPEATYAFATFRDFLLTFAEVCKTLQRPEDYARVAREYAADAAAQNVRYAEIFISPSVWTFFHAGLDVNACVRAMRDTLDAEESRTGLRVRFICDLTRNFGTQRAFETARVAVALAEADVGVIGVGLGGDEANFPAALFVEPFAFARASGLHAVAHAGEAAGAGSVRDAVELLGAERIGHGIRALEDDAVVELLAKRGIALECAPTSNVRTGIVAPGAEHPLVLLDERGIIVTIDADDPTLFGTSLSHELQLVADMAGTHDVVRFLRNAIDVSFADAPYKAALNGELDVALESASERRMER
ncbi:MAG: adenosine deaminase [Candidatus Eremiobacteraeota bacterium]|nr:adenosine deaminase [Candidatus Eremiobacteraeota bacterium]